MSQSFGYDNSGFVHQSTVNQYNMNALPGQQPGQYVPQQQGQYPVHQVGQYPPQQQGQYPPQPQGQYPPQQQGQHPPQPQEQYPPQPHGQYPPQQQEKYPPQQQGQYPPQKQGQHFPPAEPVQAATIQQGMQKGAWQPSEGFQYQGDIPDQDVDENSVQQPTAPPGPPQIDDVVAGYEQVAYSTEASVGPPPAYNEAVQDTVIDINKMQNITAEAAKEALQEYVSQQCCYGSDPAKEMSIKDIVSTSAFHLESCVLDRFCILSEKDLTRTNSSWSEIGDIFWGRSYSLETYTESRSTKWHHTPYSGGFVDGPFNGPAPGPWDIACSYSQPFKNQVMKIEVPHTATVKRCNVCYGRGFERCWSCMGRGRVRCGFCGATGRRTEYRDGQHRHVSCSTCMGSGRKRCLTCSGLGCLQCRQCRGFGQLKQFIQLTVKFTNRLDEHVVERSDLPDHLIKDVPGDVLLEQVDVRVGPVVGFLENEINQKSYTIVHKHATSWPNERILQQRQKLRAVPVSECQFKYKEHKGRFWVYGHQHKVYTTDYPHTCCCCKCTIL